MAQSLGKREGRETAPLSMEVFNVKQDRQGVRTPADIERKYDLGQDYSKVMQTATDAKKTAERANASVSNLETQFEETGKRIEEIEKTVEDLSSGAGFTTDETLTLENGVLSVNTADAVEADNTLPITSAAVSTTVGNIEVLLGTI